MADQSAEFVENCGFELSREYKPPEGYRLLQIGEVVQKDDIFLAVNGEHWPAKRIGEAVNNNRYLRRIEVQQTAVAEPENSGFEGHILREVSQPCAPCDSRDTGDMTTSEQIAEIEGQVKQPQPVQVREGRWKTRGGAVRNITPTPANDSRAITYPWHDARCDQTWLQSGRYHTDHTESPLDLWEYLGAIEQPEPEPQPEPQPEASPVLQQVMIEAQAETIERLNSENLELQIQVESFKGRLQEQTAKSAKRLEHVRELRSEVSYVHGLLNESRRRAEELETLVGDLRAVNAATEPQPQPEPEPQQAPPAESDAERQIRTLHEMIDAQAETISRLHSEIHGLNMEIGGLQRELTQRDDRIRHLETLTASQKQAVKTGLEKNIQLNTLNNNVRQQLEAVKAELQKRHPDHIGRAISTDEWMDQFARDASVSRLQADRNDLAGKVVTLREQLQQANDRVAYLEALLPTATAYTTAQTMVRDMLGHMRCLMVLQHTVNRGDFCTMLESILEVFDEAECGDDDADADDTSDTSDTDTAKSEQG